MYEGCKRLAQHKGLYCFTHGLEKRSSGEHIQEFVASKPPNGSSSGAAGPIPADPIPLSSYTQSAASFQDFGPITPLNGLALPSFSDLPDAEYPLPPPLTSVYSQLKSIGRVPLPMEYMSYAPPPLSVPHQGSSDSKLPPPSADFWGPPGSGPYDPFLD